MKIRIVDSFPFTAWAACDYVERAEDPSDNLKQMHNRWKALADFTADQASRKFRVVFTDEKRKVTLRDRETDQLYTVELSILAEYSSDEMAATVYLYCCWLYEVMPGEELPKARGEYAQA